MASFGSYPLYYVVQEDGSYQIYQADQPKADECGINANFTTDRFEVMQARGAAYGYILTQTIDLPPAK